MIETSPLNRYSEYKEYVESLGFIIVPFEEFHSVRSKGVHLYSIPPGKIYEDRHLFHFWKSRTREMVHRSYQEYLNMANGWAGKHNQYVDEWKELDRTKNYYENASSFSE